ncbi:hypothetical protein [Escherichia coli]|uniref:hypothetical protein n=1 Tax=Escherichia coli TaxID=562 RepID=UPI00203258BF|nr:hypothetical protein [Escherichia coli]
MTENTEPSSPSHPAPDPEILKSTIRAMKQSEQRANNVPALIKALLCTGTCLLISITGNAIQYWHSTNVVTNGAIVIHTQRLKSDPGGNLLS